MNAHEHAWKLIDGCPHRLNTSERYILLVLAREHERGNEWVPLSYLTSGHPGGSRSNVKGMIERPRLHFDDYPCIETIEARGKDGKTRTYYKLKGWNP